MDFKTKINRINTRGVKLCYLYVIQSVLHVLRLKKWLDDNNIKYEERHIVEDNPKYDELKKWYERSGLPLKKFFNTSGLVYKNNNIKDKLLTMSEDEQLHLLATNGMLVKRPLLIGDEFVLVGFKEDEWKNRI